MIESPEPISPQSSTVETAYMVGLFAIITLLLDRLPYLSSPFVIYSILGCIPLFLSSKPRRNDLWIALLLSAAFFAELRVFGHSILNSLALGPGFASIQTLFLGRRRRESRIVLPIALLYAFWIYLSLPLFWVLIPHLTPHTIDTTLHSIDFGIGDSFYRFAKVHVAVSSFFWLIYDSLPLAGAVVISFEVAGERRRTALLLLCALVAAVPFYLAFPAVGPAHIHDPVAQRNCIPSMHFSWALLLCAFSRRRWLRKTMIVYAALTAVATLTTGEHYFIDLIVTAPFTYLFLGVADGLWTGLPEIHDDEGVGIATSIPDYR